MGTAAVVQRVGWGGVVVTQSTGRGSGGSTQKGVERAHLGRRMPASKHYTVRSYYVFRCSINKVIVGTFFFEKKLL